MSMLARPFSTLPAAAERGLAGLAGVGVATGVAGIVLAPDRMWANGLLASYYAVGLGLGGLCVVAIHYVTGSSWSAAIRRVPEALAATLPLAGVALGVVLLARPELYAWTGREPGAADEAALAFQRWWLDRPFFLARAAFYVLVWTVFARAILARSRRQDEDGDARWTRANARLSAAFLMVFGPTFTLASFDWIMSLEPGWYSTIFGIYNFAGLLLGGLAASIVVAVWLERAGPLAGTLKDEHLHDLGKLLFTFGTFWMYIWFSQYMLIWYANIPEETAYFVSRTSGGWWTLFLLNVLLNWGVPFVALLRRDAKRTRALLVGVALIVLLGRWMDLYLMILPPVTGAGPIVGLWELAGAAGGVGLFGLALARVLGRAPLVPSRDPQLVESLSYES